MKIQLNFSSLKKIVFTLAFSLVGFFVLAGNASAVAGCTLNSVTLPASAGDYVNGNPYQITFDTVEGAGGSCAGDGAQFEAWYIYDSTNDGNFADQIWQSIGTVSPGGELAAYTRAWDSTSVADGDNTEGSRLV